MTDSELIRRMQAGCRSALAEFYERYFRMVWRYVYAFSAPGRQHVEEIVSETFLTALRSLDRLQPAHGSLGGWLMTIARNKMHDLHRRQRHRATLSLDDLAEPATSQLAGRPNEQMFRPEAELERSEDRQQIAEVLDSLPPDARQALEWKYLEDCSTREIATRLGRSEKSAESLLYRARQSFRERFTRRQPITAVDVPE